MASDPSKEQGVAREEVMKCEREIQSIKAALRRLGPSAAAEETNSLKVSLVKVEGLPDAAKPILTLQISSPVEEGTLTAIADTTAENPVEGSTYEFKGVEVNNATLTVFAKDVEIPLGESAPHDMAPLCKLDPLDVKETYVTELPIAIVPEGSTSKSSTEAAAEESKQEDGGVEESKEDPEVTPIQPICTITLQITYKPSPKDQREQLYHLLNETSQRKATALENLRKLSMAMTRAGDSPTKAAASAGGTLTKPSVKPGFLNKKKKEPTRLEQIYERTFGPNSILRKSLAIALISRNYLIFFGAVGFMHFKGQLLSLPPPV